MRRETNPKRGEDKNVFEIPARGSHHGSIEEAPDVTVATTHFGELWGPREEKYQALAQSNIRGLCVEKRNSTPGTVLLLSFRGRWVATPSTTSGSPL